MANCPTCSINRVVELQIDPRTINREFKRATCPKCRKAFEVKDWDESLGS